MRREDDAADLRRRLVDPSNVCALLGLRGQRLRGRVMVLCPAHGERRPSCSVTVGPDRTLRAHCFACGWSGDVFGVIAEVTGERSFPRILDHAADLAGVRRSTPIALRRPPPPPPEPTDPPPLPDELFASLAHHLLALCPLAGDAADYLDARGVLGQAILDGWGALPEPRRQSAIVEALIREHGSDAWARCGLAAMDDDGAALPRVAQMGARVLIPWRSPSGSIATIQRRRLDGGDEHRPRYVAARGRVPRVYGLDRMSTNDLPLAIVEGAVDVLARRELAARGDLEPEVVIGLAGTGAWRAEDIPAGMMADRRHVHIATDADAAGDEVAMRIAATVAASGGIPYRARPVGASDWCALLCAERRAAA